MSSHGNSLYRRLYKWDTNQIACVFKNVQEYAYGISYHNKKALYLTGYFKVTLYFSLLLI